MKLNQVILRLLMRVTKDIYCSQWASYQIRKIAGCACAGNAGNVFPRHRFQKKPLVNDPDMHHGTCVTHVPCCMSGSLTCCDGETFPAFPAHAHPQFCVSGKRPMGNERHHPISHIRYFLRSISTDNPNEIKTSGLDDFAWMKLILGKVRFGSCVWNKTEYIDVKSNTT